MGFGVPPLLFYHFNGTPKALILVANHQFLAKVLEDGVVFVSCDDNEVYNLRILMNEIFGEEHFVCSLVWNTKKGAQGMVTKNMVVSNHEYILVFAKQITDFTFLGLERSAEGFSNPDNDPRGLWKRQYLQRLGQGLQVRTITDPIFGHQYAFETPYTQEKLERWINEGRILFPEDGKGYPARKEFLQEYENGQQLITSLGLYATKSTTEALYGLFDGAKVFTNPKPDTLIEFLVKSVSIAGSSDIILDFFAGSGTTAQAVLEQNKEDGGNRKFILVQLPEETEIQQLPTITHIARERVRRVIQKLNGDNTGRLDLDDVKIHDRGFRAYRLAESNFQPWNAEVSHDEQTLGTQLSMHIDHIRTGRSANDLLYEILLKSGFSLTTPVQMLEIAGKTVYSVAEGSLIVCLERELSLELIRGIAERKPERVVCLDAGFDGNDQLKTNAVQTFRTKGVTSFKTI